MKLRELDITERYFHVLDRVSSMYFVIFAERATRLDFEVLQQKVADVQRMEPLLRARCVQTSDSQWYFEELADSPIPCERVTLESSDWLRFFEEELREPFHAEAGPLMRCHYLESRRSEDSCVALTFHHSIGDGRSCIALLRDLLDRVARNAPYRIEDARSCLPPMHTLFPEQFRFAEKQAELKALRKTQMFELSRTWPLTDLPWFRRQRSTVDPCVRRFSIGKETLHRLRATCKTHGVTLHGALSAAQLMAEYRLLECEDPANLLLGCAVDMRPHLVPETPTLPIGLYSSTVVQMHAVSADGNFWELARSIIERIKLQIARGDAHAYMFTREMQSALRATDTDCMAFDRLLESMPEGTGLSNIGAIPTIESDPSIRRIGAVITSCPHQTFCCVASTYQDELQVITTYSRSCVDESTAQRFLHYFQDQLFLHAGELP